MCFTGPSVEIYYSDRLRLKSIKQFVHIQAFCFGQKKKKSLCVCFPLFHNPNNLPSLNCKIPPGACFINISHSSTGLPTEDYGELLECHLCLPDQRGASTVAKHGEQRGSAQIRHLHTRHQGVMSCKENSGSRALFGVKRLMGVRDKRP